MAKLDGVQTSGVANPLLSFGALMKSMGLIFIPILITVGLFCSSCELADEGTFLWGEFFGPPGTLPPGTLPTKIALGYDPHSINTSGNYKICVMNTDESVTILWEEPKPLFCPTWSPDGSKIMCTFVSYDFESHEAEHEGYVFDIIRKQQVQLPTGIEWLPEWSPNSQKLLGVSSETYFGRDLACVGGYIYAVNSDSTGLVRLTPQPACYDSVRWSPDGRQIAFSTSAANQPHDDAAYVMPASGLSAGTPAIRLTNRPLHRVIDLQWSPDGSRIAILHTLGPEERSWFQVGLLVVRSDGRGDICARPVVGSHAYEGRFAWSPDGSRLAFACERQEGKRDLVSVCIMDADGTDIISSGISSVAVVGFDNWLEFAWSPDGRKLAFTNNPDLEHGSRYEAPWEIWVMNRDGSGLTRLSAGNDRAPAWSPDGTKIAFRRRGEIYVMNADGSQQTRVTYGRDDVYEFAWAPR